MPSVEPQPSLQWRIWAGLAVIYLVWGSTYLAIRIAVTVLPPLITAGTRFVLAGAIVALVLALRNGPSKLRIDGVELFSATLVGIALVAGGNGLVMLAERDVPSGLAALIIASDPLMVVVLRMLFRERVALGTLLGVAVGFVGVAVLVVPSGLEGGARAVGLLLLVVAAASWAIGSFLSPRLPLPRDAFVSTSYQMITGGIIVALIGLLVGEARGLDPGRFTPEAIAAVVYLLVFGSLLGYTTYTWLLQNAPISQVVTYAYVNPVVAVALGWAILAEPITTTVVVGAALIVVAVAFVIRQESRARAHPSAEPPSAEQPSPEPPVTDQPPITSRG